MLCWKTVFVLYQSPLKLWDPVEEKEKTGKYNWKETDGSNWRNKVKTLFTPENQYCYTASILGTIPDRTDKLDVLYYIL